jgi:hypothetical protein
MKNLINKIKFVLEHALLIVSVGIAVLLVIVALEFIAQLATNQFSETTELIWLIGALETIHSYWILAVVISFAVDSIVKLCILIIEGWKGEIKK